MARKASTMRISANMIPCLWFQWQWQTILWKWYTSVCIMNFVQFRFWLDWKTCLVYRVFNRQAFGTMHIRPCVCSLQNKESRIGRSPMYVIEVMFWQIWPKYILLTFTLLILWVEFCTLAPWVAVFREAGVPFEDPLLLEEVQRMNKDVLKVCSWVEIILDTYICMFDNCALFLQL